MRTIQHVALTLMLAAPAAAFAQDKKVAEPMEAKDAKSALTGLWRGAYHYPDNGGQQEPVSFQMVVLQDGETVIGFMKEPNTFGNEDAPLLHAFVKGTIDPKSGKLSVIKTYDGTGGQNHDVDYNGGLSKDGKKIEGMWSIGDFSGKFVLDRVENSRSGPLSGIYAGTYTHPKGDERKPVDFRMIIVHQGKEVVGFMKEPNTFGGNKDEPWLHAGFKGRLDDAGKLTFRKIFDGTAGASREDEFSGGVNGERTRVQGTWTQGKMAGTFTLERRRTEPAALEGLK